MKKILIALLIVINLTTLSKPFEYLSPTIKNKTVTIRTVRQFKSRNFSIKVYSAYKVILYEKYFSGQVYKVILNDDTIEVRDFRDKLIEIINIKNTYSYTIRSDNQ
jgi:hypothetical protein